MRFQTRHLCAVTLGAFVLVGTAVGGSTAGARARNTLVPGLSAGRVSLGELRPAVEKALGKADEDDASMGGKDWATWYAGKGKTKNKTPLSIFFINTLVDEQPSGPGRVVEIQVTSPYFRTVPGGLSARRSTLAQIKRAFPHVKRTQSYSDPKGRQPRLAVYDDETRGIGFLVTLATRPDTGRCVAISIHSRFMGAWGHWPVLDENMVRDD